MKAFSFATGAVAALAVLAPFNPQTAQESPTWAKDLAPLVFERCTPCHTEGGHAPFPIESYSDLARRKELVRQEVLSLEMPPCAVASDFGEFCIAKPLSDAHIVMFQEWLRNGAPEGEGAPKPPARTKGWRMGKPDMVLRPTSAPQLPLEGNPVWRALIIDPKHTKPLRISGFDIQPLAPQTVRHALLAVVADSNDKDQWTTNGTLDNSAKRLIGAWAPGYPAWRLPEGVSMVLQPGERLVVQVLLVPSGKVEEPQFDLGLYVSDGKHDLEPEWISMEVEKFAIAAFEELTLTMETTLAKDVRVISVLPEARFFAYSVTVRTAPERKVLLQTYKWNPYWIGNYAFAQPVALKKGTKIVSEVTFENELHSLINEGNRPRDVFSGPGIREEVCRTHLLVVGPSSAPER